MTKTEIKKYVVLHRIWIETQAKQGDCAEFRVHKPNSISLGCPNLVNADFFGQCLAWANFAGANLRGADLRYADLQVANFDRADLHYADLTGANIQGANFDGADLTGVIGLPDISWITPGLMVQLNEVGYNGFWTPKDQMENFLQDSFGVFIGDSEHRWFDGSIGKTFDMLVGDRIIAGIPLSVKYTGLKKVA